MLAVCCRRMCGSAGVAAVRRLKMVFQGKFNETSVDTRAAHTHQLTHNINTHTPTLSAPAHPHQHTHHKRHTTPLHKHQQAQHPKPQRYFSAGKRSQAAPQTRRKQAPEPCACTGGSACECVHECRHCRARLRDSSSGGSSSCCCCFCCRRL
jgi:hypothetical protein